MMGIGKLPESLKVGGMERRIRTDYRDILRIFEACEDPELTDQEKISVLLIILYPDISDISKSDLEEALTQARWFLDCGQRHDQKVSRKLLDWAQDEPLIFPAINKVVGQEIRAVEYMHWWTFMGYFMEIEEGTFSMVLGIRQKRAKGKKLEKWEQEFYLNNRALCDLKTKYTAEEQAEIDYWKKRLS